MSVDIVIPTELEAVRKAFNIDANRHEKISDRTWFSGEIESKLLNRNYTFKLACLGEAGNIGSAEVATIAIENAGLNPKFIVLVGIGAGNKSTTKAGEVFFSESVLAYESGVITETEEGFTLRFQGFATSATVRDDVRAYQSSSERIDRIQLIFQNIAGIFPIPDSNRSEFYDLYVCKNVQINTCGIASRYLFINRPDNEFC